MDIFTAIIIIIALFAGLFVLAMLLFPEFRGRITGPWKTEVEVEGKRGKERPAAQPEALVEDVEAGGDASSEVKGAGGRATVRRTKAKGDVSASVQESKGGDDSKKA